MDFGTVMLNLVVLGGIIAAYFYWQSFQQSPSQAWPKMAAKLGLTFEKSPPRLSGDWKGRALKLELRGERAVVTMPHPCLNEVRLEIGEKEAVAKNAGIVVPDKVEFQERGWGPFTDRFTVRSTPPGPGSKCVNERTRDVLLSFPDIAVLGRKGQLEIVVPASCEQDAIVRVLELGRLLLDELAGA